MSKETLISIIIPTFNRGHLILDTLNSVKNQSYKHWECLVVDDGSTDGTESLLQDYILKDNRFKYYDRPNTHRSGGNGARNFGVKQSQGELLVFLDSDDVLSETALENRISRFDFDTMDLLISHTGTFKSDVGDSDRIWNKVDSKSSTTALINRFIGMDMPWHTTGVTWSKEFFQDSGWWHEELNAWQDWELHSRVLFNSPKIQYLPPEPDNYFRIAKHDSIGKTIRSSKYLYSVQIAIRSIDVLLGEHELIYEAVKSNYNALLYKMLIHFPVVKGFLFFPLRNLIKLSNFRGLSLFRFLKYYSLELLAKFRIVKKYLIRESYDNYRDQIDLKSNYLKYRISDLDKKVS